MTPRTRPISWIKAALWDFEKFPEEAQSILPDSADDRGGRREGRCCTAHARDGIGRVRDRVTV
jgi:hypothetical protein